MAFPVALPILRQCFDNIGSRLTSPIYTKKYSILHSTRVSGEGKKTKESPNDVSSLLKRLTDARAERGNWSLHFLSPTQLTRVRPCRLQRALSNRFGLPFCLFPEIKKTERNLKLSRFTLGL